MPNALDESRVKLNIGSMDALMLACVTLAIYVKFLLIVIWSGYSTYWALYVDSSDDEDSSDDFEWSACVAGKSFSWIFATFVKRHILAVACGIDGW